MIEVWFQNLTFLRVAWVLLSFREGVTFVALSASRPAVAAIRLANRAGFLVKLRMETLEMGALDPQGRALRYSVESACARIGNRLLESLAPLSDVLPKDYQAYADDWGRVLRSHLVAHADAPLALLYYAIYSRASLANGTPAIYFLSARFLSRFMTDNIGPIPDRFMTLRAWPSLAERLAYFPVPGLILFAMAELLAAWKAGRPELAVSESAVRQGVALEQYCQRILSSYPAGGHLFWHAPSGLPSKRVVMLANRADSPLDQDSRSLFKQHGFGWADCQHPLSYFPVPLLSGLKVLVRSLLQMPRSLRPTEVWRWVQVAHFSVLLEANRHLARRLNVLVLHQNQEQIARPLLLVMAVRMEGGLFYWNHGSVSHFPKAREGCGMADLLLAWGPYDCGFRTSMGFRYNWLAETGQLVSAPGTQVAKRAVGQLRSKLSPEVKLVLALFDSSHGSGSHHSTSSLVNFLAQFLASAAEQPSWGVLLKSKNLNPRELLDHPEIRLHAQKLEQLGRLVILNPQMTPTEAAMDADVCVSYSINTAGISAPLATSIPSLHCDVAGMSEHLLYRLGALGSVIFKNVPTLIEAIKEIEAGRKDIGDFSAYARLFDGYGDASGNERAGRLIGDYIRGRDQGLKREAALEDALQRFASCNGKERVFTPAQARQQSVCQHWEQALASLDFEASPNQ
ncbi:hypothetical protein MTBLM1_40208 [Rhodospirillaceae bacterium LM-1]|nr:hypothetical protein MTBLM1_40208 [Rhodospirillaceae bacterium LM-1]